jgi:phosphoenolpyruvate-protein phosphotransferase (PTS system enzyme I)
MMKGIAAAPGVGLGRSVVLCRREIPAVESRSERDCETEMDRFLRGRDVAAEYYRHLATKVRSTIGEQEAEIFDGHLEILLGEDLLEDVEERIRSDGTNAEEAVGAFAETTAQEFEELDSEYFRQRAGDIRDIGNRLIEAVYFGSIQDFSDLPDTCVIVAEELSPSETARLDTTRVVALATEKGGRTSHAAILARALSIPCVTGIRDLVMHVTNSQWVVVDGDEGWIDTGVDPEREPEKAAEILARSRERQVLAEKRKRWSRETPAVTADGVAVHLAANVGGSEEAVHARESGARGSGLVRSEFFFMKFRSFPTLEQQVAEYRAVCTALAPDPVTVRLLDCGADKPLPYGHVQQEDNPFLGERGVRFLAARPDQLDAQVEAISRVAQEGYPIRLMIPMVISRTEIEVVRQRASYNGLSVGIMVETPASVLLIRDFAQVADFVSIGTNDLTQYILAVDRGNPVVADLYQEFHPAVITAIDTVVTECHAAGIHVGVCGDMASRPDSAMALLALGVDELSAGISAVPEIKAALSCIHSAQLKELGAVLRSASDAETAGKAAAELVQDSIRPWET